MSAALGAVQEIGGVRDASLDLSPYSQLSVAAMGAGYETLLDTPLPDIAQSAVTSAIDGLVSTAVQQALGSLSSVPVIGSILGWLGFVVGDLAGAEERRAAEAARVERLLAERLARFRPVGTGFGGRVMPADLAAAYLDPEGAEVRPPAEGSVPGAAPPTIGATLLWRGGPDPFRTREETGMGAVAWTNDQIAQRFLLDAAARATGSPGPTVAQALVFHAAARAVGDARRRPASDGGASLWPVMLDCLRSQAGRAPPGYWDWLASHAVAHDRSDRRGVIVRSSLRVYDTPVWAGASRPWRASVAELARSWELAVNPIYRQDRARAEEIRRQVEDEVRRILLPKVGLVTPVRDAVRARARSLRIRRAAVFGAAGAAVAVAAFPGAGAAIASVALRAARSVRGAAGL